MPDDSGANGAVSADAIRFVRVGDTRRVVADAVRIVPNTAEDALYVHSDHLGSPQKMTDATAAIVWNAAFEPYGRETSITGTETNNQRFPGQYYDAKTGLSYNWHRYYDPSIGRYITADPIGLAGGMNLYAYANANPVNFVDPEGLDATISFNPNAALGFGHVGVGVNTPDTVGMRPRQNASAIQMGLGLDVPGKISKDPFTPHNITIPMTPLQDEQLQQCIDTRARQQQDYNLYSNNCTIFVRECLAAAVVSTPPTILPRTLFDDLKKKF